MLKLNPLRRSLRGKRIIAVDDSIVRGTTSRRIIEVLRKAGASEVHIRVSSPPMRFPCFMGVDIGSTKQLVAANRSVEEVRRFIGADSLAYISIPGLMRAVGRGTIDEFCRACFDGAYPVPVPQQLEMDKFALEPTEGRLLPDHPHQGVRTEKRQGISKNEPHAASERVDPLPDPPREGEGTLTSEPHAAFERV
jgi:amidophosphoribosyltransferase